MTPELKIFKDADALDRVRFRGPRYTGLDIKYLRTQESKQITNVARFLCLTTQYILETAKLDHFDTVIRVGQMMGIIE